jgi:tRNA U34 5-methylaminomethyl-2-thiouridine-forming methyltransferase MnmC
MRFELRTTSDGSHTVFDTEVGECFKSRHAAALEVEAVFFQPGIAENPWLKKAEPFRVLELGFGLGTNALHLKTKALALELLSVERDLAGAEFYLAQEPNPWLQQLVDTKKASEGPYSAQILVGDFFQVLPELIKQKPRFHAVFFDPFSPKANPEAWTSELFQLAEALLEPEGRLVTYSVSRVAKDAAMAAGLSVEKRHLPPELNKRGSLLAVKEKRSV